MKTKQTTLSILFYGILMLVTSCGSKNEPSTTVLPDAIQKGIITEIFWAGASSIAMVSPSKLIANQNIFKSPASNTRDIQIPRSIITGLNGGTVTLSGTLDESRDTTGNVSTTSMTIDEDFINYGIVADAKNYTIGGTIQCTGSIVSTTVGSTSKTTSKLTTIGSLAVAGTGYNKTMAINLVQSSSSTVTISGNKPTSSSTVTVTGTIGGQTVNYTITE